MGAELKKGALSSDSSDVLTFQRGKKRKRKRVTLKLPRAALTNICPITIQLTFEDSK
jgi:hypothetical protein